MEVCADCGLRTDPGEPNCAALRDAMMARDFEQPALCAVDQHGIKTLQYL
jgi:hypothetical protein